MLLSNQRLNFVLVCFAILVGISLPLSAGVRAQAEETPAVLEVTPISTEMPPAAPNDVPPTIQADMPTDVPTDIQPTPELPIVPVEPEVTPLVMPIPADGGGNPAVVLAAPNLRRPELNIVLSDRTPTFRWRAVTGAQHYFVQVYNQNSSATPGEVRYTSPRVSELWFNLPWDLQLPDGTYYWNVTAVDTNGVLSPASATWGFVINQASVVPAPVTVADSYNLTSGQTVSEPGLLSNDTVNNAVISAVNGSASLNGVPTAHGSVTTAPNGSFTYTAAANYSGADSFTYTLTNSVGASTATVMLQVGNTDVPTVIPSIVPTDIPTVIPTVIPTEGGSTPTAVLAAPTLRRPELNIVLSDRTPTFRWHEVTSAQEYFVQVYNQNTSATPGEVRYTSPHVSELWFNLPWDLQLPDGTYYWNVTAVGANRVLSPASTTWGFVINQASVVSAPVTVADSYNLTSGQTVSAPGILNNDTVNNAIISAVNGSASLNGVPTAHGSVTVSANGSFTYTSAANYQGTDSFTYTLTNSVGASTATVTLQVSTPVVVVTPVVVGTPVVDGDTDGDGLTNTEEQEGRRGYVTNPRMADSDGDMYNDYIEVTTGSNPTDPYRVPTGADADADGLRDTWEFQYFGSHNPVPNGDPDSDSCGNQCELTNWLFPHDPDWDNDRLLDGPEVLTHRTNPRDQDSDNDGQSDYYEVHGRN